MNKCKKLLCLVLAIATVFSICAVGFTASAAEVEFAEVSANPTSASDFTWDNATVYFLLTDRFNNGNTSNDNSYGRGLNQNGSKANFDNVAAFQGGDFKGITQKINEGYFDDLGVNAIWVAGWFEQVHGYAVGGDGKKSFPHFAYHGYYGLDFSELDKNFGTEAEFKEMIDTAHEHGIRIVLDVVLNHPGYNTMYDMNEYNFGTLQSGWQDVYYNYSSPNQSNYHGKIDYNSDSNAWGRWWGTNWIRAGLAGYQGGDGSDLKGEVNYLPDFRTESTNNVDIPQILKTKWGKEGTLNAKTNEVNQTISKYNLGGKTVSNYLVSWYAQWVEEYGIDGFRCDTAKHVEQSTWKKLSDTCTKALQNWRTANPNAVGADWDEDFWMTGENFGQGVDNNSYYQNGFDSMINFSFSGNSQGSGCDGLKKAGNLNQTYADYANRINSNANFNVLTYISSHDTGLCRNDLYYQGSALLLLPGGVQIYYGDETNRQYVTCSIHDHENRSFMNWSSMDKGVLAHWQKVGQFRNDHVAVGAGSHANLSATSGTAFSRTYNKNNVNDVVVCVIGANKNASTTITLNGAFADGTKVVNTYTGEEATVSGGKVTVNSGAQGTILIEKSGQEATEPTTTVPVTTVKPTEVPTTAPKTEPSETKPVVTTAPKTEPSETQPVVTTVPKTEPSETTPTATTVTPPVITKPTTAPKPTDPAEYVMLGDTDFTGKVNIKDATLIQKHLAKIETLGEKAIFAGDVDGSTVLNIRDVTYIQKWLAKMDIDFKIGEEVLYKGTEASTTTPDVKPTIFIPDITTTAAKTEPTEVPTTAEPKPTETQPVITEPIPTETQPVITEPITQPNDGTETIYFVDGTPEGWIGDADAKIYIFNYETNENYAGTMQDENTWTFQVPAGMTAINFYRCEGEFSQTAWNTWTMCVTVRGSENTFTATGNEAGSWTGSSSGGDYTPPVDNPPIDNPPVDGDYIYFTDNQGWGTVYCHTWNLVGATNTPWPGDQMENVGGNQYRLLVDSTHTHLKFNGGSGGPESNEFELVIGNTYSN
ncbi:MAG: starch-binding protein [Clostridia bacterium]|nr:starch-binding protein [Clostridia bacterium]